MPQKYDTSCDKNFDDLVHRFTHNIYGKLKGRIRLAVIERDLAPFLGNLNQACYTDQPLNILDAGGGQGQFANLLAAKGHRITLCDISKEMLQLAKANAEEKALENMTFCHCALQSLPTSFRESMDMVMCHAVLEWMAEPKSAIAPLVNCLKPGGILSLAFFNENSIIYKNLVRGNYRKAVSGDFVGMEGSLTPINPMKIDQVMQWCKDTDLEVLNHSGIRVFHDYISDQATRNRHPDAVVETELAFSQQEPFRSLGRYIHVVARKRE